MSLSEREQQALQSIEYKLADDDPTLASMLAIFTRLTAGEALPARENTGTAAGSRPHRSVPARRARLRRQHAWALLWLIGTAVTLIALALIFGHGNGRVTCTPLTIACARQAPRHATGTAAHGAAPAHPRRRVAVIMDSGPYPPALNAGLA